MIVVGFYMVNDEGVDVVECCVRIEKEIKEFFVVYIICLLYYFVGLGGGVGKVLGVFVFYIK